MSSKRRIRSEFGRGEPNRRKSERKREIESSLRSHLYVPCEIIDVRRMRAVKK